MGPINDSFNVQTGVLEYTSGWNVMTEMTIFYHNFNIVKIYKNPLIWYMLKIAVQKLASSIYMLWALWCQKRRF